MTPALKRDGDTGLCTWLMTTENVTCPVADLHFVHNGGSEKGSDRILGDMWEELAPLTGRQNIDPWGVLRN